MNQRLARLFIRVRQSPWVTLLPALFLSFTAHMATLLLLALIVYHFVPASRETKPLELIGNDATEANPGPLESIELSAVPSDKAVDAKETPAPTLDSLPIPEAVLQPKMNDAPLKMVNALGSASISGHGFSGELAGRSGAARARLVARGGGTSASEKSVALGLAWLAAHQQSDGNWSFRHGPDDPGSLARCTTGATGLALLSFLGAGYTHRGELRYRSTVDKGLRYLVSKMQRTENGGDLRGIVVSNEGMYAHAIASLALCEAYGLTRDPALLIPSQQAINFIVSAQDRKGGGWRYRPRVPGDTTVTGWQVMAIKSAKSGNLYIPEHTISGINHFLGSVQSKGGSQYGYTSPRRATPCMTAIGLLCRMYMGWNRHREPLGDGVEYLSAIGPSDEDIYYDYYATQVLHHWGGAEWDKWNSVLRDQLVKTQVKQGDATGSWKPTGDRGADAGGRLYQTCLSIMTLEVYYRYLPLYQPAAQASDSGPHRATSQRTTK